MSRFPKAATGGSIGHTLYEYIAYAYSMQIDHDAANSNNNSNSCWSFACVTQPENTDKLTQSVAPWTALT